MFDESSLPFSHLHPILLLPPTLRNSHEDVLVDLPRANGANLGSKFIGVHANEITRQEASHYAVSASDAQ
jgi:hypothetical protein